MPAMDPDQIVAAVRAVMVEVPNVGIVHEYERNIRDETTMHEHMFDKAQNWICGWMIKPAPVNTLSVERGPGYRGIGQAGGGDAMETSGWQIDGYFGVSDDLATQKAFHKLAVTVVRKINSYGMIPGVSGLTLQNAATLEQFGYVMFAQMYHVHFARINVSFRGTARY